MSRRSTRWLLWVAALSLVPLPYLVAVDGAVPVMRFAMLGTIAGAYAGTVNGSGVAWPLAALLLGHALVYGLGLWLVAAASARLLPARTRAAVALTAVALGAVVAFGTDLYHTPFAAESAWTSWPGLLR